MIIKEYRIPTRPKMQGFDCVDYVSSDGDKLASASISDSGTVDAMGWSESAGEMVDLWQPGEKRSFAAARRIARSHARHLIHLYESGVY